MTPRDTLTRLDATIAELLEYIEAHGTVSFNEISALMCARGIRFGAASNPIEVLDLAAYETGRIDVHYDHQIITSRKPTTDTATTVPHK